MSILEPKIIETEIECSAVGDLLILRAGDKYGIGGVEFFVGMEDQSFIEDKNLHLIISALNNRLKEIEAAK